MFKLSVSRSTLQASVFRALNEVRQKANVQDRENDAKTDLEESLLTYLLLDSLIELHDLVQGWLAIYGPFFCARERP
jgi:hypothetical protein